MMHRHQKNNKVAGGFIGFLPIRLNSLILYLLMVHSHINPPSQRYML
jgi:hypothetical protein